MEKSGEPSKWNTKQNKPMTMTIDEFIQRRVLPEHQAIVATIRQLMRKIASSTKEVIAYGILAWKGKRIIAVISPTKKDITFAFSRGAEFDDKYGFLRGVGKVSKHIKIKNVKEVNKSALRYYVKQALKLDAK